jgi:hypothetical protein
MDSSELRQQFDDLDPAAQRQVSDLIQHLHARERQEGERAKRPRRRIVDEEFVGIWRERPAPGGSRVWRRVW